MSWRDAITLAVRGVRRRPGRAVLTVLAVLLATSLLTALLTISNTAQTRVLNQLSTGGPLASIKVAAAAPDPTQVDQDNAAPGDALLTAVVSCFERHGLAAHFDEGRIEVAARWQRRPVG